MYLSDVRLVLRSKLLQRERSDERQQRRLRRQDHEDARFGQELVQGAREGAHHHDQTPEQRGGGPPFLVLPPIRDRAAHLGLETLLLC